MSTKTSLYGVVSELDEIENAINGNGGEIDENQEVILANIQHLLTTKTDGCVKFIESQEDLIDLAKQKIELLRAFIKARENTVESFKSYIIHCLEKVERTEISGDLHKIKIRKPVDVLVIDDPNAVPLEFTTQVTETKINSSELKKAIKENKFQHPSIYLKEGKKSLTIGFKTGK